MKVRQDDPRGFVLSHESAGALDGPGLRHVVFLSGCQMRCQYCHNPESWRAGHGAWVKVSEALAKVAGLAHFYRNGGGLTLSGGEPLMQAEFCHALAQGAKAMGLHVALDTNGELHENLPDSFFDPVDMLLLDIKHSDAAAHKELTGRDLAPVLDCAKRLSGLGKEIWVRHVVIPNKTDSHDHFERLAGILQQIPALSRVDLLPFHAMGSFKWETLGLKDPMADVEAPGEEIMEAGRAILRQALPCALVV
ncbi:MAG: pyruvate formate-lyase-activating protein [Kiritimatiellae bacterium]|nr:pyruvate formate-lyase-activating protein [Kiritimatiellia bacterium]